MSQAGIGSIRLIPGGGPSVFPTDINSPALPLGNQLSVLGAFTGVNFINGIVTDGDNGSGSLYVSLSNRFYSTVGTSGVTPSDLISFDLGVTEGTFTFNVDICAFESTTPAGAGYRVVAMLRTTGVAATLIGTPDVIANEEAALTTADVDVVAVGNAIVIQVTGVADLDINWTCVGYYTFGGG